MIVHNVDNGKNVTMQAEISTHYLRVHWLENQLLCCILTQKILKSKKSDVSADFE